MSTFILQRATLDDLDELVALRLKLFRESGYLLSEEPPPHSYSWLPPRLSGTGLFDENR